MTDHREGLRKHIPHDGPKLVVMPCNKCNRPCYGYEGTSQTCQPCKEPDVR